MRQLAIFCFFILAQISISTAQNVLFEFAGPHLYEEECVPFCQEFELLLDPNYQWEEVEVTVTPNFDVTIDQNSDSSYFICINQPGTYIIEAFGFGIGPNGQPTVTATDSILVFLFGQPFFGEITGATCQAGDIPPGQCYQACEFSNVTYFVRGDSLGGFWSVQGADSYQDNQTSVNVQWGAAGSGTVIFSPFGGCGEGSICVDILPTPEPDFTSLPAPTGGIVQLCKGQPIYLENLSNFASGYEWSFGDGTTSDLFEPEHSYDDAGLYTISLRAFNECDDCEATAFLEVEVLPAPAPELSCVATVCPDEKVRYVASTDGCQTFNWTVSGNGTILSGGGTADDFIEIEWAAGPDGFIELLVEDCNQPYCDKPTIFRVPIVSTDGPISGDAQVCSGELVTYKAPYFPGVEYAWNVTSRGQIISGQNTNAVSIQWDDVSSVQNGELVSVSYGHCYLGCTGTDQFSVSIVPNMRINSNNQFCEQSIGTFSASAGFFSQTDVVSSWDIIDENGTIVWSSGADAAAVNVPLNYSPGEYTIIATPVNANDVCEDFIEKDFIITPIPPAPIGIKGDSFICPGLTYSFEVEAAGSYETQWTVIDGAGQSNYSGSIISHTFGATPPYIVEAAHQDLVYSACLSPSISKTLLLSTDAEIIGPDENCFEENSTYSVYELPGNIVEWRVEPAGMAEVSNKNNIEAEFYWIQSGNAQVILNVCGTDIIKNVIIHSLPEPGVNHPVGLCFNESASVSTTLAYESYTWRDTAGTVISMDSAVTLTPGYYSVDVTDVNGCVGSEPFHIEFFPSPEARISTLGNTGHCMTVSPIELEANTDGVNYSFQWYLDGTPVGTDDPKFTASAFGEYQVEITNQFGCVSLSNIITLFDYCGPNGGVCNGQTCNGYPCVVYGELDYLATDVDCNTKEYEENSSVVIVPGSTIWDIERPDGGYTRKTGDMISHTYPEAGYYTVIMLAEIDGYAYPQPGCLHLIAFKETVPLAANFGYQGACANSIIEFDDRSTFLPDFGITDWSWDFGDSGTSTDQHPEHTYTAEGDYTVTLVVTSTSGCTSTFQKTISVFPAPPLNIIALDEACQDNPVRFDAGSSQLLFDIIWDFDDPTSNNDDAQSPVTFHTYENAGIYNPSVEASNVYGCIAQDNTTIEIFTNNLSGDITSSNGTTLCEGELTDLIAPSGGTSWDWNTDEITSQITTGEAGHYDVIIKDDRGCTYAPDPIFIEVNPKPVVTINGREIYGPGDVGFWQDTVETCEGTDIELQAFHGGTVSYNWSTTENTSSISFTNEAANLLPPGTHIITVEVTDLTTNCMSDPAEIIIIVRDAPDAFSIASQSGSGCSGSTNTLEITNPQAGVTYLWSDGQTGTVIETTEPGVYTATATNQFGCTTNSTNSVEILQAPRADLFPSGCFVRCNPDTICIPDIANVTYYEILLDGVVVSSGPVLPDEYIATQSGSYELYLEGSNGCTSLSDVLNLELFPGFGSITIDVFVDVNENNIIDAGDTTIRNVTVWLTENNVLYDSRLTDASGSAFFLNAPQGTYTASIDTNNIPAHLVPVINNQIIEVVGCDMEFSDSLLLTTCLIEVFLELEICPGDTVVIGDSTFIPNSGFVFIDEGNGITCDTMYFVTLAAPDSGTIVVNTFFDANGDGMLDPTDSVITNIPIILTHTASMTSDTAVSDGSGQLIYTALAGQWIVALDTAIDINGWEIILGIDTVVVAGGCGADSTVINFLYGPGIAMIQVPILVELCPGDSVLIDGDYYKTAQNVIVDVSGIDSDTTFTYTINVFDEIAVTETFEDVCDGLDDGEISIQANSSNGPVSIVWDHTTETTFNLDSLPPSLYAYTVTDGQCSVVGDIEIGEYIFPAFDVTDTDPNCPGSLDGQIDILLTSPELLWSLDGVNYGNEVFTDLSADTYTIYFSNGNCVQTTSVTLEEKVIDPFEIISEIDVPVNTPIELSHNYIDSLLHIFSWTSTEFLDCSDCISPTFLGTDEDVQIMVTVTDPDGCEQAAEVLIRADQSQHIYIPNAFSPNDDAINDRFKPFVREGVVSTDRLQIFDRWGNMVYAEERGTDALDILGWDGKRHGSMHKPDLFIYKAIFTYLNGDKKEMIGEVHLIR